MNTKDNDRHIIPLTDFGFKRLFGTEQNKDLLMDYLNCSIGQSEGLITDVNFLPTEQLGIYPSEKRMYYDIYFKNQDKEHCLLEMQKQSQEYFARRVIGYISRAISSNILKGDKTYNFKKVISYNLLNFNAPEFRHSDEYFWKIRLKDQHNKDFHDFLSIYFAELCKFAAQIQNGKPNGRLEQWLYLLKNIQHTNIDDLPIKDELFEKVFDVCNYQKLNTMEQNEYEKSVLEYEDVQDAIEYNSRCAFNEGKAEGKAEGKSEGIAEGKARGKAEEKLQIARTMLSMGLDTKTIVKATGLSEEEIVKLTAN